VRLSSSPSIISNFTPRQFLERQKHTEQALSHGLVVTILTPIEKAR
jgi:hypothetical protein